MTRPVGVSPTGAPNAAETPAAAPAETKSLFSVSLRKYSKICTQTDHSDVMSDMAGVWVWNMRPWISAPCFYLEVFFKRRAPALGHPGCHHGSWVNHRPFLMGKNKTGRLTSLAFPCICFNIYGRFPRVYSGKWKRARSGWQNLGATHERDRETEIAIVAQDHILITSSNKNKLI